MPDYILRVEKDIPSCRIDIFITQNIDVIPSRNFAKKLIEFGHVRVNEILPTPHYRIIPGDEIHIDIPEGFLSSKYTAPENIPLDIFYEDEWLIVINKPSGMTVHPAKGIHTGTLVNALLYYTKKLSDLNSEMRPGIVHRLDKDTAGLIVVAKDNITHARLARQFQRHEVNKRYLAIVEGEVEFDEGLIDAPLGRHKRHHEKRQVSFDSYSKDAITYYKVIKRWRGMSLVSLFPKTGRTHQLRVHMNYIGHPILGDKKYRRNDHYPSLALLAQSIGFKHPHTNSYIEFSLHFSDFLCIVD